MNKKLTKGVTLGLACVTLLTACGEKTIPTLENGEQAVVTFSDGTMISVSELYEDMKDTYGLSVLIEKIDTQLLEAKYSDQLEAAKSSAETTMATLESYYGDDLLTAIQNYTSYTTLEQYQNYLYIAYLEDLLVNDYAESQITESEIKKYYNDEIKPDIKVSHILFSVDYADDATDDEKTAAKEAAKEEAESVLKTLKATKSSEVATKFAELAAEYSDDESTKNDGGNLGYINTDTLGDSYDNLVTAAYKLKDGKYTTTLVETELGYHIVLRTETKEKASLDDVRDSVVDALVDDYITDNGDTAYIKALQQMRKDAGMDIVDDEISTSYTNYIQNALLQAQESSSSN